MARRPERPQVLRNGRLTHTNVLFLSDRAPGNRACSSVEQCVDGIRKTHLVPSSTHGGIVLLAQICPCGCADCCTIKRAANSQDRYRSDLRIRGMRQKSCTHVSITSQLRARNEGSVRSCRGEKQTTRHRPASIRATSQPVLVNFNRSV